MHAVLSDIPFLISRIRCGQIEPDDIDGMLDAVFELRKVKRHIDSSIEEMKKKMTKWLESRKFMYYEREKDGARVTRIEVEDIHFDAKTLRMYLKETDYNNLKRVRKRKRILVQSKEDRIKASRVHKYV